jgi:hypothetical protein
MQALAMNESSSANNNGHHPPPPRLMGDDVGGGEDGEDVDEDDLGLSDDDDEDGLMGPHSTSAPPEPFTIMRSKEMNKRVIVNVGGVKVGATA